jgi:hypothetical protein
MQLLPPLAALSARSLLTPRTWRYDPSSSDPPPDSAVSAAAALVLFRCLWALGSELGPKDRRRKSAADGLGVGLGVLQTVCWALATRHVGPLR